jgi:hypothetical protein
MSAQGVDGDAAAADLALGHRGVGVEPEQRRHVERGRQAVAAARMISLNRQFVSSAVPKPANIRIVQSFERYIEAYGPRV